MVKQQCLLCGARNFDDRSCPDNQQSVKREQTGSDTDQTWQAVLLSDILHKQTRQNKKKGEYHDFDD
jgi:hypothetical protein